MIAIAGDRTERLSEAIAELGRREVQSLLIEGGPTLAAGALSAGAVDRIAWMIAPILIGGDGAPALDGPGQERLADAWRLGSVQTTRVDDDALIVGRLRAQVVGWLTRPLVGASIRVVPMPPRAAVPRRPCSVPACLCRSRRWQTRRSLQK